jgi:hypothetical protein
MDKELVSHANQVLERWLAPKAFFLGLGVSFLACCLVGLWTTHHNQFKHFERFHQMLTPETLYYPTACQVRELARARLDPRKISVIVGGSSITHGTGQAAGQVWTKQLQNLLSDQYCVLNLGFRCAGAAEIGGAAAEILAKDYPRLIFITAVHPGIIEPDPDGVLYKFFFWDAYYKGLLLDDQEREDGLQRAVKDAEEAETREGKEACRHRGMLAQGQREVRAEMAMDRWFYFQDLWNTLAYRKYFTVWTRSTANSFLRARRLYPDPDPGARSLDIRYPPGPLHDQEMAALRGYCSGRCLPDGHGGWVEDPTSARWEQFDRCGRAAFPQSTRKRTLMLVIWLSSQYVMELPEAEQRCYGRVSEITLEHLGRAGFPALEIGRDYSPADFADFQHLAPTGGHKMAGAVAGKVRELAHQLGYTGNGDLQ